MRTRTTGYVKRVISTVGTLAIGGGIAVLGLRISGSAAKPSVPAMAHAEESEAPAEAAAPMQLSEHAGVERRVAPPETAKVPKKAEPLDDDAIDEPAESMADIYAADAPATSVSRQREVNIRAALADFGRDKAQIERLDCKANTCELSVAFANLDALRTGINTVFASPDSKVQMAGEVIANEDRKDGSVAVQIVLKSSQASSGG